MRACVLMRITDLGRDTIGGLGVDQGLQPPAVLSMTGRIPAKGVRQDVDIRENHPRFSIMSRRAAESLRHAGHPLPVIRAGLHPREAGFTLVVRPAPGAILLSIRDYVRLAAPGSHDHRQRVEGEKDGRSRFAAD